MAITLLRGVWCGSIVQIHGPHSDPLRQLYGAADQHYAPACNSALGPEQLARLSSGSHASSTSSRAVHTRLSATRKGNHASENGDENKEVHQDGTQSAHKPQNGATHTPHSNGAVRSNGAAFTANGFASKPAFDLDEQWTKSFPRYMQSKEDFLHSDSAQGSENGADRLVNRAAHAAREAANKLREARAEQGCSRPHVNSAAPPSSAALPPTQGRSEPELIDHDPTWAVIRAEARLEAEKEPMLSSFLYASILGHPCFERSLGFVLANRLKDPVFLATQLMDVFDDVFMEDKGIQEAIRADVQAVRERDPSCGTYSCALLYLKGYHALQAYRVAHALWNRGQRVLALAFQSRISEVFGVDIHPAARIGKGVMLDHGTGIVIGETAVVGDRVSMLQGVTLGGTGKDSGDRHPKIGEGVLIGAGATILGNIKVGKGAMVAAGSLVLKDVPPHAMVAGTPAKVVGESLEVVPALTMEQNVAYDFCQEWEDAVKRQHELELSFGSGI